MNQILETTDYRKFKFMNTNREVDQGHVSQLVKGFRDFGNLTRVSPILVNEKMEVIDGQHRLTACVELREPVFYTIGEGLGVAESIQMNLSQKNWEPADYARSYANAGNKHYQKYLQLQEEYGFVHSLMLGAINSGETKGGFSTFRNGEMVIDDLDTVKANLDLMSELQELNEVLSTKAYVYAALKFNAVEGYDEARLLRKIKERGIKYPRFQNTVDAARALEETYNHKITEANRLRLY